MSIIEQTLDKLERTSSPDDSQAISTPYNFRVHQQAPTFGKSLRIFIILFGVLFTLAFFVINQGVKLNISIEQDKIKTLQKINKTDLKGLVEINKTNNTQYNDINETPLIATNKPIELTPNKPKVIVTPIQSKKQNTIIHESKKPAVVKKTAFIKVEDTKIIKPIKSNILKPIIKESNTFPELSNLIPQQINLGNYQNVINILNKYKQTLINTWEYHYWQSQAYIGLGQLKNADKTLDIGIEKDSQRALLWIQKGLIFQEKNNHQSAIDVFKKAEFLHLKPASLYLNMGYSAAVVNDLELANRAYNKYLSMTKNDPEYDYLVRQQVIDYLQQIN